MKQVETVDFWIKASTLFERACREMDEVGNNGNGY